MFSSRLVIALLLVNLLRAQAFVAKEADGKIGSTAKKAKQQETLLQDEAPARQLTYKSYSFAIGESEKFTDYMTGTGSGSSFGKSLHGRKPLGRLLLVTKCTNACGSKDATFYRTLYVNTAATVAEDGWKEAGDISPSQLTIRADAFSNPNLEFAINGTLVRPADGDLHIRSAGSRHYYIQAFERNSDSCRRYHAVYGPDAYSEDTSDALAVDLTWTRPHPQVANGIVVGAPKIYDTYALTRMLNDTAQKLGGINPFVASQITGNYGTLQGISRDQSYLNVQAQAGYPAAGSTTTGTTNLTSYCPAGYYPVGPSACAPVASGSTTVTIPATSVSQTVTPTTPITPTIPSAPPSVPLTAPGNVGQSSADSLVEQVQLSGQLQTYQLLLQGAQSDTLLLQNSRAVAARQQTTIGFPISLDPPRQFRHAVAEVRILIEPFPTPESGKVPPVSIVNLLPSQKTYNVAKITSNQRAFGGAAVIDQVVNVGVSTGKSKDRLYLAKDTDTVALQYDHPAVKQLDVPLPERTLRHLEEVGRMQRLEECKDEWFASGNASMADDPDSRDNSVLFGWQFRPVLGSDYVASGPRQVFAQLALPEGLQDSIYLPAVLVQTRWREYDEKRQVVGPVFRSSCSVASMKDPVIINNPIQVHDSAWEDVGNGILKLRAHGTFFSPGIALRSGNTTYAPVTFDGSEIQFFAPAKDLLSNGDLKLVGENSHPTSLTIPLNSDSSKCGLKTSFFWAIPQADGTAKVRLTLEPQDGFKDELPKTHPLVLIGSDIYGLRDKPFQDDLTCDKGLQQSCVHHFTASSDSLRAASNYYVRDIAWSNSNLPGAIHFAPFLSGLAKYSEAPPVVPAVKSKIRKVAEVKLVPVSYLVSGTDLKLLRAESPAAMQAFSMDCPGGFSITGLTVLSDTEAVLTLPHTPSGKTLTISWKTKMWPLSQEPPLVWDLTLPGKAPKVSIAASPAYVSTGDSRTVTYTGGDFSNVADVSFESLKGLTFKPSPDGTSMDLLVPSAVTKDPGHKEMIATTKDKKGKTGQIILPIDVFKQ